MPKLTHPSRTPFLAKPTHCITVLKACGSIRFLEMGEEIHEEVKSKGLLGKTLSLGTTLVSMYAKSDSVSFHALVIFDDMFNLYGRN